MDAPYRGLEVERLVRAHSEIFKDGAGKPIDQDDPRLDDSRRAFLPVICATLNAIDGGEWGLCSKDDQGGKIPSDIIVWRPTREHFDVLTGTGPSWQPRGIMPNTWRWVPAPQVNTPGGTTDPGAGSGDDVILDPQLAGDLERVIDGLERMIAGMAALVASNTALAERLDTLKAAGLRVHL